MIRRLHHVQITIPRGAEEAGRQFYCQVLGLMEVTKPDSLQRRGGFWLQLGPVQVHVGTEDDVDRSATKAHIAYEISDLEMWRMHLQDHGVPILESIPIPGFKRLECRDPFGNRIEFIERDMS
jgi:catechol 2,3-dioxygenase-like lactoylglutathione lyase family enzyme